VKQTWQRQFAVVACALLSFAACLPNPWLWDDSTLLGKRLSASGCSGLADIWAQPYWGNAGPADTYRPLSLSFLYLERLAFGDHAAFYHIVSLALHAAVSLLVMWVIGRLAGPDIGWFSGLLFSAHPIHAEAVAMAYGQLELLSVLFGLLAIGLFDRALREGPRLPCMGLALLSALAAMFSKESAAVLPALLLLTLGYRVFASSPGERRATFAQGLRWSLLFWLLPIPYLLLRNRALGTILPYAEATVTMDYTPLVRLKLVVVSAGESLRLCLLPSGQTLYYGHLRDAIFGRPYADAAWLLAGVAGVFVMAGEIGWPAALFGFAWFAVTFFPVSNVVPSGVVVAERTLYAPVLGFCFMATAMLVRLRNKKAAVGAAAAVTLICVIASTRVVLEWRDDATLWRSTVASHPRSPKGNLWLGEALIAHWNKRPGMPAPAGELEEAASAFPAAYRLNPTMTDALIGSGIVAARQRNRAACESLLNTALAQSPNDPNALEALRECRQAVPSR
jgi:hypothetical protein